MGLFSLFNKNKQETAADDGSYVSRDDDDGLAARARSKRATSANEPAARRKEGRVAPDPVLPEKKRARRRLVGAVALALGVAVGLPMILDSEPKPLSNDIDIRIPAKEKALPQEMPAPVAASESLGDEEQIVESVADPVELAPTRQVSAVRTMPARDEVKAPVKPAPRSEPRAELKPAVKAPVKAETRPLAVVKPEAKPEAKLEPKPEPKPAAARLPVSDSERAVAILEDKPAAAASQKVIVQVAALASQDKASELQAKLRNAGIMSFTQKGSSPSGPVIRVRVGPYSKEEGDRVRARLVKLGLSPSIVQN